MELSLAHVNFQCQRPLIYVFMLFEPPFVMCLVSTRYRSFPISILTEWVLLFLLFYWYNWVSKIRNHLPKVIQPFEDGLNSNVLTLYALDYVFHPAKLNNMLYLHFILRPWSSFRDKHSLFYTEVIEKIKEKT
jgi:hypothetical protein